jgi:hypothetical protein
MPPHLTAALAVAHMTELNRQAANRHRVARLRRAA